MPMLIIGGESEKGTGKSAPFAKKSRSFIGGNEAEEDSPEDGESFDAKAQAVDQLVSGLKSLDKDQITEALEAFVYACKE